MKSFISFFFFFGCPRKSKKYFISVPITIKVSRERKQKPMHLEVRVWGTRRRKRKRRRRRKSQWTWYKWLKTFIKKWCTPLINIIWILKNVMLFQAFAPELTFTWSACHKRKDRNSKRSKFFNELWWILTEVMILRTKMPQV